MTYKDYKKGFRICQHREEEIHMQEESGKMTAQEYLEKVKAKEAAIKNLEMDRTNLLEMMYSMGSVGCGERVQSSKDPDKFGTLYGRIDEKERKIADEIDKLIDFKLKVSGEINQLEDGRYVELLYKRYIQHESWDAISVDMQYSLKYIMRLHRCALKEFSNKFRCMLAESY